MVSSTQNQEWLIKVNAAIQTFFHVIMSLDLPSNVLEHF
jgi:hypothetical protein